MKKQVEKISSIAKNYAQAIIEIAKSNNISYDSMLADFETVTDAFAASKDFQIIMENTSVDIKTKYEIIDSIFGGKISQQMINFIKILIEKKRISELPQIYSESKSILYKQNNIQPVTIVSAVELTPNQQEAIIEKLSGKLQKTITPEWEIDSSIIAGLKIEIEDNILDLSLQNKIKELEKSLILK